MSVPYGVGDTVARDHQYFPTLDRDKLETIMDTIDPTLDTDLVWGVPLTLAQILAVNWKVRKWQWSGSWSASATAVGGADAGKEASMSGTIVNTPFPSVQFRAGGPSAATLIIPPNNDKEGLLVSNDNNALRSPLRYATDLPYSTLKSYGLRSTGAGFQFRYTYTDDDGSSLFQDEFFDPFLLSSRAKGFDIVVFEGDRFYPAIVITNVGISRTHLLAGARVTPHPLGDVGMGTLKVKPVVAPEFTIPLFLNAFYQAGAFDSSTGTASMDLVVTATEFHPYVNSLGQPCFSTTTGAQVADPFL